MDIVQLHLFDSKQCIRCREWKPLIEYRKHRWGHGKLAPVCKRCQYQDEKRHHAPRATERRAQTKRWQQQHKEQHDAARKAWRKVHKERVNKWTQKRRAHVRGNGGSYTYAEWDALCTHYDHRCLCCWKQKPLTPDHIVPVSKGGSSDITNIQPLCQSCNSRKKDRTIDYRGRWLNEPIP